LTKQHGYKKSVWTLRVDGASRNNPGPSGAGIYIEKDGVLVIKEGYYLGIKTNNQAEYLALLLGLFIIEQQAHVQDSVRIFSDSQLLVRQLIGMYKVKEPHLRLIYLVCKEKMQKFEVTIAHVMREHNTQADEMANHGVDCKVLPPQQYIALLKDYDILL
jgi:ribonuclease HI